LKGGSVILFVDISSTLSRPARISCNSDALSGRVNAVGESVGPSCTLVGTTQVTQTPKNISISPTRPLVVFCSCNIVTKHSISNYVTEDTGLAQKFLELRLKRPSSVTATGVRCVSCRSSDTDAEIQRHPPAEIRRKLVTFPVALETIPVAVGLVLLSPVAVS
jgi:hypothetical protein